MGIPDMAVPKTGPVGVAVAGRCGEPAEAEAERAALARLLGPRAKGFLRVYDRRVAKGRRYPISWSWAGLLMNARWAAYRRLYGIAVLADIVAMLAAALIILIVAGKSSAFDLGLAVALLLPVPLAFALFGRALVVENTLRRMAQPRLPGAGDGAPVVAAGVPAGPLRGLPTMALALLAGSIVARVWSDMTHLLAGPGGARESPVVPTVEAEAALTGILAIDRPLGMLLVNALTAAVILLGCRFIRRRSSWPGMAAVALGYFGAFLAAMIPYDLLAAALLPTDPQARLLAVNYLLIGPCEEAIKLILLLALVLRWEPVRDPKTALVAAVLVGAGFALLENLIYLQTPVDVAFTLIGRLLLPFHLLPGAITGIGVYGWVRTGRLWPVAIAGLGAVLVHGAFDHGAMVLTDSLFPDDRWSEPFLRLLGIDPAAVYASPRWPALVEVGLVTSTALAAGYGLWRCLHGQEPARESATLSDAPVPSFATVS